ncbi:MAG: hypothetical protein QOI47_1858 [Actinomycetota bacterium]|nr:hypothetical protein [Actinomycetota bacterium]
MRDATVGIIANPLSGRDIRRLIANAAPSTIADKVTIVRRVAIGAVQAGARRLLVLPDPHGICRRALSTLKLDVVVEEINVARTHDERESVAAAGVLRDEDVGAIVVLGGDGTNRAVTIGWNDAPVVALSTGTNNVFPGHVEPTIAGAAAGLVASGAIALEAVSGRAKTVRIDIEGAAPDVALVDALLTAERLVGSRALFAPSVLRMCVLTTADPASVGISSIGGLVHPCRPDEDRGVELRFEDVATASRSVLAPLAPGAYAPVGLSRVAELALGEIVESAGPGILALDGERQRAIEPGAVLRFRVERDGPRVIDVATTMRAAAEAGVYVAKA